MHIYICVCVSMQIKLFSGKKLQKASRNKERAQFLFRIIFFCNLRKCLLKGILTHRIKQRVILLFVSRNIPPIIQLFEINLTHELLSNTLS